jgi:hypothetical protein
MSEGPRIVYRPRGDATAGGELRALAQAYSYVLRAHHDRTRNGKEGGLTMATPDDAATVRHKEEVSHVKHSSIDDQRLIITDSRKLSTQSWK